MRPSTVFANVAPRRRLELEAELRAGRVTLRAPMIWCSARGEPAEAIAEWLDCHPRTVRRWIRPTHTQGGQDQILQFGLGKGHPDGPPLVKPCVCDGIGPCHGDLDESIRELADLQLHGFPVLPSNRCYGHFPN